MRTIGQTWRQSAWDAIDAMHKALPTPCPLEQRKKALEAAYPFDSREHYPYKAWLKARREHLDKYDPRPIPESKLGLFR
jgi:hypothetical protein